MQLKVTPADKSVVKNVLVTKIVLVAKNALATKTVPVVKTKLLAATLLRPHRNLKADALKANFVRNANTVQLAMIVVHAVLAQKANVVNLATNSVASPVVNVVSLVTNNLVANAAKVVQSALAFKSSLSSFPFKSRQAFGQVSLASLLLFGAFQSVLNSFLNNAQEITIVVMGIAKMAAVTDVAMDIVVAVDHVALAVAVPAVADLAPIKAN